MNVQANWTYLCAIDATAVKISFELKYTTSPILPSYLLRLLHQKGLVVNILTICAMCIQLLTVNGQETTH